MIVILLIAAGAGLWYWSQRKTLESENPTISGNTKGAEVGLGAEAFNKTNNPLANELPETNPFQVNTNPFEAEINPFDKDRQNPFE